MDRERGSLCPRGSRPQALELIGDGTAPGPGVVLHPAPPDPAPPDSGLRARWLFTLLAVLGLLVAMTVAGSEAAATPAVPEATTASPAGPALVLQSQTPWVTAGEPFDLRLRLGSVSQPLSQLGLSVAVYACLSSVTAFDQSVSGVVAANTEIASTPRPLAVTGLPALPAGGFDLSMPVQVGSGPVSTPAGGFAITLPATDGQCQAYPSGVYPVRVTLTDKASGQSLGSLTTHLVYTDASPTTEKLRLALVLPIRLPITASHRPPTALLTKQPSAAVEPPAPSDSAVVTGSVAAVARNSTVSLTLEASPQTMAALNAATSTRATVTTLADLADSPGHQFAWVPYTPVNAAGLVATGLGSELTTQVDQGTDLLADLLDPDESTTPHGALGAWITADGLDPAAAAQLDSDGYQQLIVPAGTVSSAPADGSATDPFTVTTSRGTSMTAITANADLTARFSAASDDPVLAAHLLVAELAQIYYEKPNDTAPRAVVAVPPSSWTDSPAFIGALLSSLAANPIIEPVTNAELFADFPAIQGCRGGCRLGTTTDDSGLPAKAIRGLRRRVDGFASATSGQRALNNQLGSLVLAAESESLRPAQQSAIVGNGQRALGAQLSQLAVDSGQITLTAQRGRLPVTIVSTAPYPVTGSITLESDKLLFPNDQTQWSQPITLQHAFTVINVNVQTRVSGQFKVSVALRSPTGLILGTGQIEVRSTATSVVGIVLSVGALVVLAVWWIRTSRKRRRTRRHGEADLDARDTLDAATGTSAEAGAAGGTE